MAVTHRRPRVTGAARRIPAVLALLALAGSWTGTAGAPAVAALVPSPALIAIDAGGASTCALVTDGTIRCWGANGGALGNGTLRTSIVPVTVTGIDTATGIAVGGGQACAVLADGTVRCWGDNELGQLGNGSETHSTVPVKVLGLTTAVAVAASRDHTCALLADGGVACWGFSGLIGDGSWSTRLAPVPVDGIDDGVALAAGAAHTCVLRAGGGIACWGHNDAGQLGDGTLQEALIPTEVAGMTDATSIAAGGDQTCASRSDGTVACWGSAVQLLGYGFRPMAALPEPVEGVSDAVAVAATATSACARAADGTARCWGGNARGQLGDGTKTDSPTPVSVTGLAGAAMLDGGRGHVCAIGPDQTARCWGENGQGQLGDRSVTDRTTPVPVRWDPDTTGPTITAIRFELVDRVDASPTGARIIARYPASDGADGTGIDSVQVQKSRDGGPWFDVARPTIYGKKIPVRMDAAYRIRVRAWDRAGNLGPWRTSEETRVRLVQDTASSLTYTGAWTQRSHDRLLDGSARYTRTAGASVSYRFTGWAIGFIGITSQLRGEVDVYLDGALMGRFDTKGSVRWRQLIDETHWTQRATHTVTFVNVGTVGRPRIDFDALVVIR